MISFFKLVSIAWVLRDQYVYQVSCRFSTLFFFENIYSFLVNYRGSLGFGQTSLHSLPGNVGTQDVQDVQV